MNRYDPIQEEGTQRLQESEVMHVYSKSNICQKQQGYHMYENIVAVIVCTRLVQDHISQNYSPGEGEALIEPHPLAKEQLAIDGCSRGRVFFRDTAPERQCMLHHVQAAFVGLSGFLKKCTRSWVQKVEGGFKKELEKRVWWVDLIKTYYMHCEIFK